LKESGVDKKKNIEHTRELHSEQKEFVPTHMPDAVYMPGIYLLMRY
jgi:hypothetical protein